MAHKITMKSKNFCLMNREIFMIWMEILWRLWETMMKIQTI